MLFRSDFVKPARRFRAMTDAERPAFQALLDSLGKLQTGADSEAIQFQVYEIGKANGFEKDLRGTPGHGLDYIALGEGRLRDDALRDVGALLVWIGLQTDLDRDHIVMRHDAGGAALAHAALAMYGERIKPWGEPQILRQHPPR